MDFALISFTWLDEIEKEFDNAAIAIQRLSDGTIVDELRTDNVRKYLATLSTCFARVVQRAQNILQSNVRFESRIKKLEDDLVSVTAEKDLLTHELHETYARHHQLQLKNVQKNVDQVAIQRSIENQLTQRNANLFDELTLRARVDIVTKENRSLNKYIAALQNELYGSRLAAKYLDKELAGRVQQIQLACKKMDSSEHERLWNTLESEIHLHRHKTVARACRGRKKLDTKPRAPPPNCIRRIVVNRRTNESLGISITGGAEHGVPIMVSDIAPDHVIAQSAAVHVGDAILSVNEIDLRDKFHRQAVKILSKLQLSQAALSTSAAIPSVRSDEFLLRLLIVLATSLADQELVHYCHLLYCSSMSVL